MIAKIQDGQRGEGHFKGKKIKVNDDATRVLHAVQNSIK